MVKIIIVKISEAESTLNPDPPKCILMKGTMITRPKNPYTTEGIPASPCMVGFNIFLIFGGAISARNMEQHSDNGTANRRAINVVRRVPIIIREDPKYSIIWVPDHSKYKVEESNRIDSRKSFPKNKCYNKDDYQYRGYSCCEKYPLYEFILFFSVIMTPLKIYILS